MSDAVSVVVDDADAWDNLLALGARVDALSRLTAVPIAEMPALAGVARRALGRVLSEQEAPSAPVAFQSAI
jgi:hypothetical protein